MLALSRKKDEAIIINDDIEITIIEIKGDQVKLGISAPEAVPETRRARTVRTCCCVSGKRSPLLHIPACL